MTTIPHQTGPELAALVSLRRDLLADGWTDQQIHRALKGGVLTRIRHGAYVATETWDALSPTDQHRTRARALLRTAHPDTVLSHTTALIEHGVPVWGQDLSVLHTTRTTLNRAGRRQPDWTPHRGGLPAWEVVTVNGVRTTTPVRAAVELTTIASVEQSLVSVNALLNAGAFTPSELHAYSRNAAHWPRSLTTDLTVRLADPRMTSVGETRTSYFLYRHHLPRPEAQFEVRDEGGHIFAWLDFAWPDRGVFLEFDGQQKYQIHRRPGETLEEFVMREKRREERICALTGWVCIRITWADLADGERTATRIRNLLGPRHPHAA